MAVIILRVSLKIGNYSLINVWDWWLKSFFKNYRSGDCWTLMNNQNATNWKCNFMKEIRLRRIAWASNSCHKRNSKHGCRPTKREDFEVSPSVSNWMNSKRRLWKSIKISKLRSLQCKVDVIWTWELTTCSCCKSSLVSWFEERNHKD